MKHNATAAQVDRLVGERIRARRVVLGLTQQQLANLVGVTYQQAHKYERGINRVSAGRLFEIARVLRCPVESLFPESSSAPLVGDMPRERLTLDMARQFAELSSSQQEAVAALVRSLASDAPSLPKAA